MPYILIKTFLRMGAQNHAGDIWLDRDAATPKRASTKVRPSGAGRALRPYLTNYFII